ALFSMLPKQVPTVSPSLPTATSCARERASGYSLEPTVYSPEVSALFERMEGRGQELVGSRLRWHAHYSSATSYGRCGTHAARYASDQFADEPMLRAPAVWSSSRSPKDRQVPGRGLEVRSAARRARELGTLPEVGTSDLPHQPPLDEACCGDGGYGGVD